MSTFKYAAAVVACAQGGSDVESLRRLGKILHLSITRSLIVKCDEPRFVKLGTKTCDSKLKEIGRVQDFFGPVSSPYISIRPTISSPSSYLGRIVYSLD
jgi:rRNA processing protein Gar1